MKYDPAAAPSPGRWLATDDEERLVAVLAHHADTHPGTPNARLHAALHVVVENQVAQGYPAVVRALERLMAGGMHRHAALHAVADVVAAQMRAHLQRAADRFETEAYEAALDALTPHPDGP